MAKRKIEILRPLNEIYQRIESSNGSIDNHLKDLVGLIKSEPFYEEKSIDLLLEFLKRIPDLESEKIKGIFKFFRLILQEEKFKRYIFVRLFNYSLKLKDTDINVRQAIFEISVLKEQPKKEMMEVYLVLNEQFCRAVIIVSESANRDTISKNVRFIMSNINDDESFQMKFFQFLSKSVNILHTIHKEWKYVAEHLTAIIKGFRESTIKVKSEGIFLEYLKLISYLLKYGQNSKIVTATACELIKVMKKVFVGKEHALCNDILLACWRMTHEYQNVEAHMLKEMDEETYKELKDKSQRVAHQKTLILIVKMFEDKLEKFVVTEDCFISLHKLCYTFLHTLKNIKSEENIHPCCSDIRRHESLKLTKVVLKHGSKLAAAKIFNVKIGGYVEFYVKYALQICDEMKCPNKEKEVHQNFCDVYNLSCEFFKHTSLIASNLKFFNGLFKICVPLIEQHAKLDDKTMIEYYIKYGLISYDSVSSEDKSTLTHLALGYTFIFILQKKIYDEAKLNEVQNHRKLLIKIIYNLRRVAKLLTIPNATKCLINCFKHSEIAGCEALKIISQKDILSLEFLSLMRYEFKNVEEIATFFQMICDDSNDLISFAHACNSITDSILRKIDLKKFEDLNARLEKFSNENDTNDIKILIALAFNNYYLFYIAEEALIEKVNDTYLKNDKKIPDCLNLQSELNLINYLNKSLEYFAKILHYIKQDKSIMQEIASERIFMIILENISIQYFVRGIEYKDVEAKTMLWTMLQYGTERIELILDTASYFLDNHNKLIDNSGNNIRISKTINPIKIEEITMKSNKIVDKLSENFQEVPTEIQVRVLIYLISLWSYNIINGRRTDGFKVWDKFNNLLHTSKAFESSLNKNLIEANIYFVTTDINLHSCKRTDIKALNQSIEIFFKIKKVGGEMRNIFQYTLRKILTKLLNYCLNRLHGMDDYLTTLNYLKEYSVKKGFFLQSLEFTSMSALWKLNMEKIDEAKIELNQLSKLLEVKEEILVEIPTKFQSIVELSDQQSFVKARRAVSNIPSPKFEILHDQNDTNSSELIEQLEKFIHGPSCKCKFCQYPQMKFILFQTGCHYSRLFWLMDKFDISKGFNENALDPWRYFHNKLQRSSKTSDFLSISRMNFITFSIRWLFQVADAYIKTKNYSEAEEIYTEVDLLCTNNIFDYDCLKESLYGRKENLTFLMEHGLLNDCGNISKELQYDDFIKRKRDSIVSKNTSSDVNKKTVVVKEQKEKSAQIKKVPSKINQAPKLKNESVIFIDSSEDSSPVTENLRTLRKPQKDDVQKKNSLRKKEMIEDDDVILVDTSDDSPKIQAPKPLKKYQKTPAATTKKSSERLKNTKADESDAAPVLRQVRKRMI